MADERVAGMLRAARWYASKGFPVFPLGPRDKKPLSEHGFKDAATVQARIRQWWTRWPEANTGVPTGAASGWLVVDVDPRNGGEEALEAIIAKYGRWPDTAEQLTGGGGRHVVFRYPAGQEIRCGTLGPGLDLKGDGGYIVVAPSIHPSGKPYRWDGIAGAKALLSLADPPRWLLELAQARNGGWSQAGDGEKKWPAGERNSRLTSIAGTMRRRGTSREAIEAALLEENQRRCDPPLPVVEVKRIAESVARYEPAEEAAHAVAVLDPPAQVETAEGWPDPLPIQGELPPVDAFSEELLPDSLRSLVRDVAERMQVPPDYPAAAAVLCLAGAVNRRATIQPKAHDTSWVVVPNLWGGIVGPPGFMKSPVIQAVTRPLLQIQSEWLREHEEALNGYQQAKEEFELRRAAWREQFKASTKANKAAPARPEGSPEEPTLRRLIVNDATFEALHQTMSENPAGILVIRDELTGWWSTLERAGREGERAFCLQAWNGDTGHTIDRIERGTIHVEACCMSMLGGIQPGRLRSYLVDAVRDGPANDGLIQRFQVLVWPDTVPDWTYVDREPAAASEEQAARVFRKLVELDPDSPARFRFAPEAQQLFVEWLEELEAKVRGDELHPALVCHLSKYRKLMPGLALLFELADWATGNGGAEAVSLEHTKQAAAWCDYLESHARRIYSCVVTPQLRAARELADKIKRGRVGADGFFTCRDVYLKGWSGLDTPEAVRQAVEVLEDAGWVRELAGESHDPLGRGRPSARYGINPKLGSVSE